VLEEVPLRHKKIAPKLLWQRASTTTRLWCTTASAGRHPKQMLLQDRLARQGFGRHVRRVEIILSALIHANWTPARLSRRWPRSSSGKGGSGVVCWPCGACKTLVARAADGQGPVRQRPDPRHQNHPCRAAVEARNSNQPHVRDLREIASTPGRKRNPPGHHRHLSGESPFRTKGRIPPPRNLSTARTGGPDASTTRCTCCPPPVVPDLPRPAVAPPAVRA